jgi:hypothetical protein
MCNCTSRCNTAAGTRLTSTTFGRSAGIDSGPRSDTLGRTVWQFAPAALAAIGMVVEVIQDRKRIPPPLP